MAGKLVELFKGFTDISQWSLLSLYGTKEILFDRVRDIHQVKGNDVFMQASKVDIFLNRTFLKKDTFLGIKFNVAHGSLNIVSGLLGSLAAAHRQGWMNVGNFCLPLEAAACSLFGFASLIALIRNINIYRAAIKIPEYAPLHVKEAASMLKKSAILGIISSLNYIVAAALLIIGSTATLALIFGCIAVSTGCLKILYDFIRFKNAY